MSKEDCLLIEDSLCKAFVLTLGTKIPDKRCFENMVSWVRQRSQKEQKQLTEEFVYNSIPLYLEFLFNKS